MPNTFSIIGQAWDFYKKQPVFNTIVFWLFALPISASISIGQLESKYPSLSRLKLIQEGAVEQNTYAILSLLLADLILSIIILWGTACVLLISKKLLNNKAGRTRSSFNTVKRQAGDYVANLFVTSILRSCLIILWSLLFIIPGILYAIRTFFFHIAIVCEEKKYRSALEQSATVVRGQTWKTLGLILGIAITIYLPILGITGLVTTSMYAFDARLIIPLNIVSGCLWGIGTVLFTISSVILYTEIKKIAQTSTLPSSWLS